MKLSKAQKQRAIEQMHDLMLRLPLAEEADRIEQCWTAAEDTVDSYITAADSRASDLPPSEQLGEACFNLISLVDLIRDDDNVQLVCKLLTPEFRVELFGILPRVKRLRDAAMAKLAELAEQQSRTKDESPSTDFDLF